MPRYDVTGDPRNDFATIFSIPPRRNVAGASAILGTSGLVPRRLTNLRLLSTPTTRGLQPSVCIPLLCAENTLSQPSQTSSSGMASCLFRDTPLRRLVIVLVPFPSAHGRDAHTGRTMGGHRQHDTACRGGGPQGRVQRTRQDSLRALQRIHVYRTRSPHASLRSL